MNLTHVQILFLPGAAGNFFTRCLCLASDQCYGFIPHHADSPKLSLDEKFFYYQYLDSWKYSNWVDFENMLIHYNIKFNRRSVPPGSFSINQVHPPGYPKALEPHEKTLDFYIDPSSKFEWMILNALHKDSPIIKKELEEGKKLLQNPGVYKINLTDIIDSPRTLLNAVEYVCECCGIVMQSKNRELIQKLWCQWHKTTLPEAQWKEFKTRVGYLL